MRYIVLIMSLAMGACAATPASSTAQSNLCTIEDQEAGLCDGPMTRAIAVAVDNGYDPYNDPRVLTGCMPGSGACYVVVTDIGGSCKNWYAICSNGSCSTGCMPNPNDEPPVPPLAPGHDDQQRTAPSFCQDGDTECGGGGGGGGSLTDTAEQALYGAAAGYGVSPMEIKAGCGSEHVGTAYCDAYISWNNHYVFLVCRVDQDPETGEITSYCFLAGE